MVAISPEVIHDRYAHTYLQLIKKEPQKISILTLLGKDMILEIKEGD